MSYTPLEPIIQFKDVSKRFGNVVANDTVNFSLYPQTIHGIVGENGAGKSSIMKALYGMYLPDSGHILVRGKEELIANPNRAIELGIGMVHQHFMLVPTLSVWQNIILGREPSWKIKLAPLIEELSQLQKEFGFNLNLFSKIEELTVGEQQRVEILKLLYRKADILILDEPTAVLTPQEVDVLFERLTQLQQKGKTIALITHKLREVLSFTNTVTIMRKGTVIKTLPTKELTQEHLAELIVGRQIHTLPERTHSKSIDTLLEIKDLTLQKPNEPAKLQKLNLNVKSGEIVGIAGVAGNGQDELVDILALVEQGYEGTVYYQNQDLKAQSTYDFKQKGVGIIPSDRHREAILLNFSVQDNLLLGHHREDCFTKGVWISQNRSQKYNQALLDQFDVRPRRLDIPISALSGGNQQKLVIARELFRPTQLIIAAHPTRGVDIGAIEFIHSFFLTLRDQGAGILLISTELDEILALSDRIYTLYSGSVMGELGRENANERQIGSWMTGGGAHVS